MKRIQGPNNKKEHYSFKMQIAGKLNNNKWVEEIPKDIFNRELQLFKQFLTVVQNTYISQNSYNSQYDHRTKNTLAGPQGANGKKQLVDRRVITVMAAIESTHAIIKLLSVYNQSV